MTPSTKRIVVDSIMERIENKFPDYSCSHIMADARFDEYDEPSIKISIHPRGDINVILGTIVYKGLDYKFFLEDDIHYLYGPYTHLFDAVRELIGMSRF